MNEKQKRWLIYGGIVLLVLILALIISPWILFPALIVALIGGALIWGVMSAEASRTPKSPNHLDHPSLSIGPQ